jgi:hypothetical protein
MDRQYSFQRLIDIKLPDLGNKPGPLHTILQDEAGNLYFTDEINHSLVCLDSKGKLLWQRSGRGPGVGHFWYPKGIDLGWIINNGEKIQCIAVCDSWNNRIQFFTLDGGYACSWAAAGEVLFKSVVDIRFVKSGGTGRSDGFWLVLDRDNHRLCGLDLNSHVLWQTGRMLTKSIESRWLKGLLDSMGDSFNQEETVQIPIFDPLFYPERILGCSVDILFIKEPGTRQIKQLSCGNLFPVWLNAPHEGEWISADSEGLLSWSRQKGILSHFDLRSRSWQDASIEGIPISSGRHSNKVWFQNEHDLEAWTWDCNNAPISDSVAGHGYGMLVLTAEEIKIAIDHYRQHGVRELFELVDRMRSLGLRALAVCTNDPKAEDSIQRIQDDVASLVEKLSQNAQRIRECTDALNMAVFKAIQAQQHYPNAEEIEPFMEVRKNLESLPSSASSKFAELAQCMDGINIIRYSRLGFPEDKKLSKESREAFIAYIEGALLKSMQEIASLYEITQAANSLRGVKTIPDVKRDPQPEADPWIPSPIHIFGKTPPMHFREIDRISLCESETPGACLGPVAMTHANGDQILVLLSKSNRIAHLDEHGKSVGILVSSGALDINLRDPYSIAVDAMNRIWISERLNNLIQVLNIEGTNIASSAIFQNEFQSPHGICCGWGETMLVADTGNNRIVILSDSGTGSLFGGKSGTNPVELKHPTILFRSPRSCGDSLWVADSKNHRLQELDSTGCPIRIVGGPGLGKGTFTYPESVVQLEDGVLAVSYYTCSKTPENFKGLKVFSPDGSELSNQFLDYDSRGMLVHQGLLLISDPAHDCIHVYERN